MLISKKVSRLSEEKSCISMSSIRITIKNENPEKKNFRKSEAVFDKFVKWCPCILDFLVEIKKIIKKTLFSAVLNFTSYLLSIEKKIILFVI